LKLQYAAVADAATLEPAADLRGPRRLLIAAFLGKTRLIDNIPL
jgi:pantoate--beta-alanine ligase